MLVKAIEQQKKQAVSYCSLIFFFSLPVLHIFIQFLYWSIILSVHLLTERQVERRQNDGEETSQREKNGKTLMLTWNKPYFPWPWSWSRNSSQYTVFPSLQSKCLSLISGTEKTGVTVSERAEETSGGYGAKGPSGNSP